MFPPQFLLLMLNILWLLVEAVVVRQVVVAAALEVC
jgi:hypothetical protein